MIVKLQKSIRSSQPKTKALVYNQDRTVWIESEWDKLYDRLLGRDEVKAYFEAELHHGGVMIGKRVPDEAW